MVAWRPSLITQVEQAAIVSERPHGGGQIPLHS
jgi:hypothetical protein